MNKNLRKRLENVRLECGRIRSTDADLMKNRSEKDTSSRNLFVEGLKWDENIRNVL